MAIPGQYAQFPQYPQTPQGSGVKSRRIPPTVQRAVAAMYSGAVVEAVTAAVTIARVNANPAFSAGGLIGGVIGVGLWVWMAVANRDGRHWARVTGTVFFGIASLGVLIDLLAFAAINRIDNEDGGGGAATGASGLTIGLAVLNWAIGLFATIMIWNKQSADYYRPKLAYGPSGWGAPGVPGMPPYGYQVPYQQMPGQDMPQLSPYQQVPGQIPQQSVEPANPWDVPQG